MPAFNTNLFKLVNPDYFCSHVHQAVEATEALTINENQRQEQLMKAYLKLKPSQKEKGSTVTKGMQQAITDDSETNKVNYFLLS